MTDFWDSCLLRFEQELPPQQFNTWLKPLRVEAQAGPEGTGTVDVFAPNGFILKWVRERYLHRIEELGQEYFNGPITLNLKLGDRGMERRSASLVQAAVSAGPRPGGMPGNGSPAASAGGMPGGGLANGLALPGGMRGAGPVLAVAHSAAKDAYEKTRLIEGFTFDNLVVGKANDLARAAAMQVAHNPGGAYNPLFIYGGAGLGKTHLIHAIGNGILKANPNKTVRYVHAEDYYSGVVQAYQQKSFDVFKRYYRSMDVLLLDDVQFFNGKGRTQEEFFYVFNALFEAKKQIVITCDTYPKEIEGLEDRLITRFDWGLTVQIEPPETEMRVAILKKKAEAEGVALDDEVAFFIAKHLKSNVRELEGALKKVLAYSQFHGRAIALDMAKEALKDVIGAYNRQITVENIQKTVAEYYKIKVAEMFSKKRTRAVTRPRQVAMWLCKEVTPHSYPAIGEAFGGRDHTTVLHAVRTIESLRTTDNELNHDLHVLVQVLKG